MMTSAWRLVPSLVLKGTPQEYMQALGTTSVKVFPLNPGDKQDF